MARSSGGTATSTRDLAHALNLAGCCTDVLTLTSGFPDDLLEKNDFFIKNLPNDAKTPLKISHNVRSFLERENEYDLYHTNGIWLDINHATARIARQKRKPCIISLHGMLYPGALARSSWKKKLMLALGHRRDLSRADCIHATCIQELKYYRCMGFVNPVAVIPNSVSIPEYVFSLHKKDTCFRIGFIGRLHPIKRVHDLISAWKKLGKKTEAGELLIIGDGSKSYLEQLHAQVADYGLKNVRFTGFLFGRDKFEAMASLSALFLPSDSENFGMVVPEALLAGTPVVASQATPWEELLSHRCGWWVKNDVNVLADRMEEILSLSVGERFEMGQRGRSLVLQNYSSEMISHKVKVLYEYVLNGGETPEWYEA